ncbi:MAG: helix-turn-helix domain-containing protein [Parvibaculum sp.]|uniref:helix-turn-helix domain-containing protein n=1 Tax=Parvibaculum sp. TaxID=2024848 RepID=UPI0027249BAC|nr:helix-turn-helix domain-containing protein [Parvibaculum sp.]MDO8839664.1 helix-turn-helix domain-containing protein [Parvibaculum sp.]
MSIQHHSHSCDYRYTQALAKSAANAAATAAAEATAKRREKLTRQARLVLRSLEAGRATTRVTAMHYGVMNLTARISELRNAGYDVVCTIHRDVAGNKYGEFKLAPTVAAR